MATLTFRNSQGELVEISTVAASRFKNEFGAIFEKAALGGGGRDNQARPTQSRAALLHRI